MANIPIALQLYTVRDQIAADFAGTLEAVSRLGFAGVEFAGYGGMTARQVRSLLNELGLNCAGAHEGLERLESDFEAVVDFHKALENKFVTIPFLAEERRKDAQGWKKTAAVMNEIGQRLKAEGLVLSYHNHSFEFQKFDGLYGLEILYGSTSPDVVKAELDTYWVQHGGEDPVQYIKKYADRICLVHLKDMAAGEGREFAEVGEGILDIKHIFSASQEAGAEWMIVEQDTCARPPLESVKISIENIHKMGLA